MTEELSPDSAVIKPGLYRTTEDVANPQPDRRQRHDWRRLVTIPAGTLITVHEDIDFPGAPVMCSGRYTHHWVGPNNELYTRLARVLTPAPLGLDASLIVKHHRDVEHGWADAEDALQQLLHEGWTSDDVLSLLRRAHDRMEQEDDK